MVNAQKYINQNFLKDVSEISTTGGKNLEGDLDLSEYTNLTKLELGFNPRLKTLKLPSSSKVTWISLYKSGIDNFSFLADAPNIQTICLPRTEDVIGDDLANAYIAQVIREICQQKNQELERLNKKLGKLSQENHQQLRQFSQILSPNQNYNFNQLQTEIARLKYQELAPQVQSKTEELERLIAEVKSNNVEVSFTGIIDLFLNTQKQIIETKENNDEILRAQLEGQLTAYQNILEGSLNKDKLWTLLDKQTELLRLEKHLASLRQVSNQ